MNTSKNQTTLPEGNRPSSSTSSPIREMFTLEDCMGWDKDNDKYKPGEWDEMTEDHAIAALRKLRERQEQERREQAKLPEGWHQYHSYLDDMEKSGPEEPPQELSEAYKKSKEEYMNSPEMEEAKRELDSMK